MRYVAIASLILAMGMVSCEPDPPIDPNPLIPPTEDHGPPVENTSPIEGYANQVSYHPGDSVFLMLSSSTDSLVNISVYRLSTDLDLVFAETDVPVKQQDYYQYSYSFGCYWDTTYRFKLADDQRSGYYVAAIKNSSNNTEYITFIVKEPRQTTESDVLVIASSNTWQAYNKWGGGSFYRYEHNDLGEDIRHSVIVSFNRPNKADSPFGDKGHLVNAEMHLIRWLEENEIDYAVATDRDIHGSDFQFTNRKVVMLHAHPEYYSTEMLDHLESYNTSGGNIMYLGANGLYWKVTMSDNDQLECRKDGDTHKYGSGTGGLWKDKGRSPSLLVGVHYSGTGYDTYHPYSVIEENHWVFDNTGLGKSDLFGENSLNGGGASGHETDKRTENTPEDFELIARGTNPDLGGAQMVIRESAGRGIVFSVGSITYTGALSVDSNVHQITMNVLDKCLE